MALGCGAEAVPRSSTPMDASCRRPPRIKPSSPKCSISITPRGRVNTARWGWRKPSSNCGTPGIPSRCTRTARWREAVLRGWAHSNFSANWRIPTDINSFDDLEHDLQSRLRSRFFINSQRRSHEKKSFSYVAIRLDGSFIDVDYI